MTWSIFIHHWLFFECLIAIHFFIYRTETSSPDHCDNRSDMLPKWVSFLLFCRYRYHVVVLSNYDPVESCYLGKVTYAWYYIVFTPNFLQKTSNSPCKKCPISEIIWFNFFQFVSPLYGYISTWLLFNKEGIFNCFLSHLQNLLYDLQQLINYIIRQSKKNLNDLTN